jgi:hypothetical protein
MTGSNNHNKLIDELANLLNETAEAHHKGFVAIGGVDPDWPIWHIDYLFQKMRLILKATFTKSDISSRVNGEREWVYCPRCVKAIFKIFVVIMHPHIHIVNSILII